MPTDGASAGGPTGARTGGGRAGTRTVPAARVSAYPAAMDRLIDEFAALPGIGRRSAERMAFHVLKSTEPEALGLARAIEDLKRNVRHCDLCANLTDGSRCPICGDERRDRSTVLVVEQPKDLIALEQTGMYRGVYHVLLGRLSPLEQVGPAELTIAELLARAVEPARNPGGVLPAEFILGLNPTLEGDGTALYLSRELKHLGARVSRLARGLPSGTPLEYANRAVLADAIEGRRSMD